MTTLLKAVQQALEALVSQFDGRADAIDILSAALAQQAEPFTPDAIRTTQTAWKMGYDAAKAETQQAEPVQEPVGTVRVDAGEVHIVPLVRDADRSPLKDGQAVYAAPPPRKPLTDEEILEAVGWERAEMYMKLTPNFPVEEARKETLKNARAVEAKHCIKE